MTPAPAKVAVAPNGVDTAFFMPTRHGAIPSGRVVVAGHPFVEASGNAVNFILRISGRSCPILGIAAATSGGPSRAYRMHLYDSFSDPWRISAAPKPAAAASTTNTPMCGFAGILTSNAYRKKQAPVRMHTASDRIMLADQVTYLPDDHLVNVDRVSVAVSLEVRVPLLEHRVVEFFWTLPASTQVRDGEGEWRQRWIS
jgi:hypothetical protein